MTNPVSGSDSNRPAQNQPPTPSASAEQSAAQRGRNVGQEAAIFQSQFGSGSSATRDIPESDTGSEEPSSADSDSSSTQSTQDSDSKKVTEKKEDKKEGSKDEKKADARSPTDAQGNVLQQQSIGQAAVGQKTALPHDTSINSIINQVIDKLQVSAPQLNGGQEVRMTLKTPGLGGTEVSITKTGNNLNITFDPKSPEAMKFLAANVAVLQDGLNSKLPNLNVNINVGDQSTQQENNEGRSRGGGGDQQGQGQQGQQGQQR